MPRSTGTVEMGDVSAARRPWRWLGASVAGGTTSEGTVLGVSMLEGDSVTCVS